MKIVYNPKHYYTDFSENYASNKVFWDYKDKPEMITIKPTLSCIANCLHCNPRSKKFDNNNVMTIEKYRALFKKLKEMGTKQICISGGEPLLYKNIEEMVSIISSFGIAVTLNTNGWLLTKQKLKQLIDAGLVGVNVSIDSPSPEMHNKLRGVDGIFEKTVKQLKECKELEETFYLNVRMILSKYTYKDIIGMIKLCKELDADTLSIDMIEADAENKYFLLNENQILEFRNCYLPKVIKFLENFDYGSEYIKFNITQLNDIFNLNFNSPNNFASGIYWPDDHIKSKCSIPYSFAIIEGDGSVLPCNAAEYNRNKIIGNCAQNSFENIWNSRQRMNFCENKMDFCKLCPMNMSFSLVFKENTIVRHIKEDTK